MAEVFLILFILCAITTATIFIFRSKEQKDFDSEPSLNQARETAASMLKMDKRLASLTVLLSYAEREDLSVGSGMGHSNRRLIFEMRQIVSSLLLDTDSKTINMVTAQLLVIAKNIGDLRRARRKK